MTHTIQIEIPQIRALCDEALHKAGMNAPHRAAITDLLTRCQIDDCQSHGLFRLIMCTQSMQSGLMDGQAQPRLIPTQTAITRVDAAQGASPLAFETGLPDLVAKARKYGVAAMVMNRCFHFSALWPELETIADHGLAAMAMLPSHAWVAPAGGTRGSLGTNPFAFAWPRQNHRPFVFDFATSGFARGEIELYLRAGKALPEGVAIGPDGAPTTDPKTALEGAMLPFGGHKGSALSLMIELMAGPLIDDLTSLQSMAYANGAPGAPYHGEIILAFDPHHLSGNAVARNDARAEALFNDILGQGARLPAQRRYAARDINTQRGYVEISATLMAELEKLRA